VEVIAPRTSTSGLDDVSSYLHAPAALPVRKAPQYPLDWRLGGVHIQSGRSGEEENCLPLLKMEPR